MSWTVKQPDESHSAINELREAVKEALDARILLFCAAADTGVLTEVEYPWSCDQRRIFRIGAATADGRVWGPKGSPQAVSFVVPGHRVVARSPAPALRARASAYRPRSTVIDAGADADADADADAEALSGLPVGFEERTGSSVATALAAGLAALVLHCVRLAAIHSELEGGRQHGGAARVAAAAAAEAEPGATGASSATAVRPSELARLKDHEGMLGALRAVGLDGGQQRFIEVWRRFDAPAQNLRAAHGDAPAALRVVAGLARDLVSGITAGSS
jgi:hypothetical protein